MLYQVVYISQDNLIFFISIFLQITLLSHISNILEIEEWEIWEQFREKIKKVGERKRSILGSQRRKLRENKDQSPNIWPEKQDEVDNETDH